jgi:hypothetical protein
LNADFEALTKAAADKVATFLFAVLAICQICAFLRRFVSQALRLAHCCNAAKGLPN